MALPAASVIVSEDGARLPSLPRTCARIVMSGFDFQDQYLLAVGRRVKSVNRAAQNRLLHVFVEAAVPLCVDDNGPQQSDQRSSRKCKNN